MTTVWLAKTLNANIARRNIGLARTLLRPSAIANTTSTTAASFDLRRNITTSGSTKMCSTPASSSSSSPRTLGSRLGSGSSMPNRWGMRNMSSTSMVLGLVSLLVGVSWNRKAGGSGTGIAIGNLSGSSATTSNPSSSSSSLILPPTEARPHRLLTLPNQLEVILISDPTADKSAAALDVGIGHLEDPADLPGCAHFCEHLMFLGTKKYPEENAYNTYLSSHNGHSNAYTDLCNTNYYFEVSPNALEGALDRFAGFFSEPLFAESCTEREANAVNSEHKKNLQSDMWRFYQLEKHLSSPLHPYHKFGTGSLETLWNEPKSQGRDPRAELIEWWKKEYCSSRMKLVVLGKDSLDTLEGWVRERFEKVPYKGKEKVMYSDKVFEAEQMGHIVFVEPVKDTRGMEITFPFPDQRHLYKSKPASYLAHFLGHEGPGSILSYLKRKGWVNSLRAGAQNGSSGFELFKVTVDLTEDGLVNYEKVAQAVYKYLHLLKSQPPSEEAFNEIKALAEIGFRFVEKGGASSYVSDLARQLHQPVPREKIISSQWLVEEFDAAETAKSLEFLDVRKSNIAVSAQKLPPSIEGSFDLSEPVYETKYKRIKMSQSFIDEALNGTLPELHLPGKNAFIPENLEVNKIEVETPKVVPDLIKDTPLSKLWFKKDDRFWVPRANVFLSLKSPILQVSPRNTVLARLFVDLFRDSIAEETYDAELAGLQFSLDYAGDSLTVGTVGYNDKLPALTEKMLGLMRTFKVDETRFGLIKDQLRRQWQNANMEEPYHLVTYYAHYAEADVMWTLKEKVDELEFCTPEGVDAFAKEMFERLYIEGLIHGNMEKEGALALQTMVESVLKPRVLTSAEKLGERSMLLPEGSAHVWNIDVTNPSEVNSALEYYCEVGDIQDDVLRPQLSLLASLVSEPTFNVLRTKEQLGYVVYGLPRSSTGTMGLRFIIQSEKDTVFLENRVEAFLDYMKEFLDKLSEEEYEKHKEGVILKKLEKPKNLHGESSRFWTAVEDGYYDFERRFRDADATKAITKQQITDLFMSRVHYSSPIRKKLSIHMRSTYKGVKFDPARATPVIQALMGKQVPVNQEDLAVLLAASPGLPEIQKFARDCLSQATHLSDEDKQALNKQVDDLDTVKVAEGEKDAKLREGNVIIDDIIQFKAGLRPSKAANPVQKFTVV